MLFSECKRESWSCSLLQLCFSNPWITSVHLSSINNLNKKKTRNATKQQVEFYCLLPNRQTLEAEVCWKRAGVVSSKATQFRKNDRLLPQSPFPVKHSKKNNPATLYQINSRLCLEFLLPFKIPSFRKCRHNHPGGLAGPGGSLVSGNFLESASSWESYLSCAVLSSPLALPPTIPTLWPSALPCVLVSSWAGPRSAAPGTWAADASRARKGPGTLPDHGVPRIH